MEIDEKQRYKILQAYCLVFALLLFFKWITHSFLFQVTPSFYYNSPDLLTWLVMATGLQKLFVNNTAACWLAEIWVSILPFLCLLFYHRNKTFTAVLVTLLMISNLVYIPIYCIYPTTDHLNEHPAVFLMPLLFYPRRQESFAYLFKALRYFFLFYIASAGLYKLVNGGVFDKGIMPPLLLMQHKELIWSAPGSAQASVYFWLIDHAFIAYLLYLAAALIQLSFIIGFFTVRADRFLLVLFILFLIADSLLMRLYYWKIFPFGILLFWSARVYYTSRHHAPENAKGDPI